MRRRRLVWGAMRLACLLSAGTIMSSVHGASFDCTEANSKTEKLICQDPALTALDEQLAVSYRRALLHADDPSAFRKEQRAWLQTRNACSEAACLKALYAKRIADLDRWGAIQSFTGSWAVEGSDTEAGGAWLDTEQVNNTVKFSLEISLGAPSYNTGWMGGEFELDGNVGHFRKEMGYGGVCEISFYFSAKQVEVKQGADACGFGDRVFAGGVLRRASKNRPKVCAGDPRAGECDKATD